MNALELHKDFFSKTDNAYIIPQNLYLKEDVGYVPRFKLKDYEKDNIAGIPLNEPMKYSDDLIIKAIKLGLCLHFTYKGAKDPKMEGSERICLPVCLGRSAKGKTLLRVYHVQGFSISGKDKDGNNPTNRSRHVEKVWRMFRTDRVLNVTLAAGGYLYRMAPDKYNMKDKGMRGGIICAANFDQVRKAQHDLLKKKEIQNVKDITLNNDKVKSDFVTIKASKTGTLLDLTKPFDNPYINNVKIYQNIRITFMKSIYGNKYIAVIGAVGEVGKRVKIMTDGGVSMGTFRILDSLDGLKLKRIKNVKGNKTYPLYVFDKKL